MSKSAWNVVKQWAWGTDRDVYKSITINNGTNQYDYGSTKVRSITINGNMGGLVEITLSLAALGRSASTVVVPADSNWLNIAETAGSGLSGSAADTSPIPYWRSQFGSTTTSANVTAWTFTVDNRPVVLYTFNASPDPKSIQVMQMVVTGTYTRYPAASVPVNPGGSDSITFYDNNGASFAQVTFGNIIYNSWNEEISGPANKTTRTIGFTSIASPTNPAVKTTI